MTGLVFDIKHFALHDGPGLRTTVFFKGCPLNCLWCHNPEGISTKPQQVQVIRKIGNNEFTETDTIGKNMSAREIFSEIEKDRVFYEESGGGVTFSGGEPLNQHVFLLELVRICNKENIHVCIDTSGYVKPGHICTLFPFTDLFLYDIKMIDDQLHKEYTGVSNRMILENLDLLLFENKRVIIRYPLIPGVNDSQEHLLYLHKFLNNRISEIHFLPYHTIASHKYQQLGIENKMADMKVVPGGSLAGIKEKFEKLNYAVTIGG